ASFISSKEGGTPASFSRSLIKRRSSYCLRVSISTSPQVRGVVQLRDSEVRLPKFENSEESENPGHADLCLAALGSAGICRPQYSKQIMNGHYMFHMCSATT